MLRSFKLQLIGALALVFALPFQVTALPDQTPLPGALIPKFVDPVPTFAGQRVGGSQVIVSFEETVQRALPESFYQALPPPLNAGTRVLAYRVEGQDAATGRRVVRGPSWPGVTVEARSGRPTTIVYANRVQEPTVQRVLPGDQTIHWADPLSLGCQFLATMTPECMRQFAGPVPMVVHLHGSEVPPAFDGGPDQWFTADGRRGPNYASLVPTSPNQAVYRYPNGQEATTLWFHDHALGATRLNVLGGVAAFYFVRDALDDGRPSNPLRLPAGAQEVELILQDRSFDTSGQLLYDDPTQTPNPEVHPYWRPEFFGDVITVNGKSWPYLRAEPRRYRLRLLNGSNARFYHLALRGREGRAVPFWQIGSDGGRLDAPARQGALLLAPGERADVIVDLTRWAGETLTLVNDANAPYPDGDPIDPETTGLVMQLRVGSRARSPDDTCNPATSRRDGCDLRPGPGMVRLVDPETGRLARGVRPVATRQLILEEVASDFGPLEVVINNTKWAGFRESTLTTTPLPVPDSVGLGPNFATEAPQVGATEVWELANLTVDAHPIHLHLVQFQVLNRQALDTGEDPDTGAPLGYLADWVAAFSHGFQAGDGPPRPYLTPNEDGALGGNPGFGASLVGPVIPPAPGEAGWKDTVVALPGQVTRLAVRWAPQAVPIRAARPGLNLYGFDPSLTDPGQRDAAGNPGAGGYVFHCHILEHEDNEMMRPYAVQR